MLKSNRFNYIYLKNTKYKLIFHLCNLKKGGKKWMDRFILFLIALRIDIMLIYGYSILSQKFTTQLKIF